MSALETTLIANLDVISGYARKQAGDPDLAAEAVQQSLLKALEAAPALRDETRLLPWFYRILNNTITDLYRRRSVQERHQPQPAGEQEVAADPVAPATVCRCFEALLPSLNPEYAALIRMLELDDQDPQAVADRLGLTRNHLKVKRHRARQQLRQRLEATCRLCAEHGCLDCTCRF